VRSVAYSSWQVHGLQVIVNVRMTAIDYNVLRANRPDRAIAGYLQRAMALRSGDQACVVLAGTFFSLHARLGWMRYQWELHCPAPPTRAHVDLLFDQVIGHIHLTIFSGERIVPGRESVLTAYHREVAIPYIGNQASHATTTRAIGRFAVVGMRHILSGWDHLVFLFALILLASSISRVALAVTGFTLGHSITLALGVLGLATPNAPLVEALIGLSIVLVAVENVWLNAPLRDHRIPVLTVATIAGAALVTGFGLIHRDPGVALALWGIALFAGCHFALLARSRHPDRFRGAVAVLFGLVHGLAFAGALRELLPDGKGMAAPLFGFNLGVEAGQIAVLALLWPLLVFAQRVAGSQRNLIIDLGSAASLAVGLFWFVSRI